MKNILYVILFMLLVAACAADPQPTLPQVPVTDTSAPPPITPPTITPIPPTADETADWQEYVNAELGYSLKYPAGCSFGPMAADCKQNPPEERPLECLCFLSAEDPYVVGMQSFLGDAEEGLSLATLLIAYHDTAAFNPPQGEAWIPWLDNYWSGLSEDIPDEPNLNLGGLPGVRIYTPGSPQAYAAENIFVVKDGKLIQISMIDVDVEEHREFYESILSTFQFSE